MVKGGQLIRHTKAVVISLIISDIVHDPVSSIASGPTSPDPTTFSDARDILVRYHLWTRVPTTIRTIIEDGIRGRSAETLKDDDPAFDTVFNFVVANNERACKGAYEKAVELGYDTRLLTTSLIGDARDMGRYLVQKALKSLIHGKTVFISSGETTVTVLGGGSGGRNQEFVLSCVEEITNHDIVVASFATDGIDGNSSAAGAIADGCTLARAAKKKLFPSRLLEKNNSFTFFSQLGDFLQTGPTGTNVMDIQIMILS
jgi:glycerate-2-kinase